MAGLLGHGAGAGPGEEQLKQAFSSIAKPDEWIFRGFNEALGITDLPPFVKTALGKVIGVNVGMLQALYIKLQDPQVVKNIDENACLAAGRIYLEGVIRGLLSDLLPAFSVGPGSGLVNKDMIANKAASLADELAGEHLKPILHLTMNGVYQKLAEVRAAAEQNKSVTMEVYLAVLPQLIALMTRNTFFPVWQIVVEKVFGAIGAGAALIGSPVKNLMDTARATVKDTKKKSEELGSDISDKAAGMAKDVQDKEKDIQSTLAKYNITAGSPAGQAAKGLSDATGGLADSILGTKKDQKPDDGVGASFPGSARLNTGSGKDIEADEWNEVNDKQHVTPA